MKIKDGAFLALGIVLAFFLALARTAVYISNGGGDIIETIIFSLQTGIFAGFIILMCNFFFGYIVRTLDNFSIITERRKNSEKRRRILKGDD